MLCYWGFGLLAARRLRSHGPELLDTMRTGRRPEKAMTSRLEQLPKAQKAIAGWCFGFGAIPLVPQGIVAAVFVSNGMLRHSWFLATYMPPGLRARLSRIRRSYRLAAHVYEDRPQADSARILVSRERPRGTTHHYVRHPEKRLFRDCRMPVFEPGRPARQTTQNPAIVPVLVRLTLRKHNGTNLMRQFLNQPGESPGTRRLFALGSIKATAVHPRRDRQGPDLADHLGASAVVLL